MDLYKVLGVRRNASAESISAAYREKAKTAHPDGGGDRETWDAIAEAYQVLSDAEARAHYDATGEVRVPGADNRRARAIGHIDKHLVALMMADGNVRIVEVIGTLQDKITEEITALDGAVRKLERAKARLVRVRKRLRPKTEKERGFEALIAQQLREVGEEIEMRSEEIRTRLIACEILDAYEFEPEEGQAFEAQGFQGQSLPEGFFAAGGVIYGPRKG